MTYCAGLRLNKGLVLMSDTRTNAGVDNISTFKKMFTWSVPGDRVITVLTAGNLATTQAVISLLSERMKAPEDRDPTILNAPTMFQVASIISNTLREVISNQTNGGQYASSTFSATIIVAGQVAGIEPRLFLIYPEGNFIEASMDTPFFQIGETKYGKPILVRGFDPDMSFENAVKLLLLSFDSTIKANLTVDLPLDLQVIAADALDVTREQRITADHPYYQSISSGWGVALKDAFYSLPNFEF